MPRAQYEDGLIHYEILNAGNSPLEIWHHGLMTSGSDVNETPVNEVLQGRHVC